MLEVVSKASPILLHGVRVITTEDLASMTSLTARSSVDLLGIHTYLFPYHS